LNAIPPLGSSMKATTALVLVLLATACCGQEGDSFPPPVSGPSATGGAGSEAEPLAEAEEPAPPQEELTAAKLFTAASVGDSWEVERLLGLGMSPDIRETHEIDPDQETAVMKAALNNHDSVIKVLIDKGADVMIKDIDGRTPLLAAATAGRDRAIYALFEASQYKSAGEDAVRAPGSVLPVNDKDQEGRTALLLACVMGHLGSVRALLDSSRDIDIDGGDRTGRTPLMWAVTSAAGLPLVELLLERGASVVVQDSGGSTALTWAMEGGHKAVINAVARYGSDTDVLMDAGDKPRDL